MNASDILRQQKIIVLKLFYQFKKIYVEPTKLNYLLHCQPLMINHQSNFYTQKKNLKIKYPQKVYKLNSITLP